MATSSNSTGAKGFYCCVYGCNSTQYNNGNLTGIHFFRFPNSGENSKVKRRWCERIKRQDGKDGFVVNSNTRVCEKHFKQNDIRISFEGRWQLKSGVEPTVFPWAKNHKERPLPKVREILNSASSRRNVLSSTVHSPVDQMSDQIEEMSTDSTTDCTSNFVSKKDNSTQTDDQIDGDLNIELEKCNKRIQELEKKVNALQRDLEQKTFCFDRIKDFPDLVKFYTGFKDSQIVDILFDFLNPGNHCENINFYNKASEKAEEELHTVYQDHNYANTSLRSNVKSSKLNPKDQFLMTLCRLKQGFHEKHLAFLFGISQSTVSRYFLTWINYMYLKLGSLCIWPAKEEVVQNMPPEFKRKYPKTRVVIDCTEIYAQVPDSLVLQKVMYSEYKHATTYKGLVGVTPSGAFSFISQLYPGATSDREIVIRSGFLNSALWKAGEDSVMADRGFTIQDLLEPLGVELNIPAFLGERDQLETDETIEMQQIAKERINVERAINRVKKFHILNRVIPLSVHGSINQIWTVCCLLCNAQDPLISF